jgi:hypothetical protein
MGGRSGPSPSPESGGWWTFPVYIPQTDFAIGQNTSIAINKNGKTIVCYTAGQKPTSGNLLDAVGELKCYHNFAGSFFQTDVVDWDVRLLSVSVAIDPVTNLPGVVYSWGPAGLFQPKELWYAWMDGYYVWHQVKVADYSGYAFDLSLAIDSSRKPHIAFRTYPGGSVVSNTLRYATLKSGAYFPYVEADSWTIEYVPLGGKNAFRPQIKVGNDNIPRIIFHSGDFDKSTIYINKLLYGIRNGVIKYTYKIGQTWYFEDVDYTGIYSREVPIPSDWSDEDIDKYLASQVIGVPLSFYLDASNNPVISYYREDTKSMYLAPKNPSTGAWDKKMIDAGLDTDSVAINVSRSQKARVAYNNSYLATECQNVVEKTDVMYFQEENKNFLGETTFGGQCYAERLKTTDFSTTQVMDYIKNNEANFDFTLLGGFTGGLDFNKIMISALLNQQVFFDNSILGVKNLTEILPGSPNDHCNRVECGVVNSEFTCWIPEPISKAFILDEVLIDRRCTYNSSPECKDIPTNSLIIIMKDGTQITVDLNMTNAENYGSYFGDMAWKYWENPEGYVIRELNAGCGSILDLWKIYEDWKDDGTVNNSVTRKDLVEKIVEMVQPGLNCIKPLPKFPLDAGSYFGIFDLTVNSSYLEMGCSDVNCGTGFAVGLTKGDSPPGLLKITVQIPLFQGDGWMDIYLGRIGAYNWLNDTYLDLYYLPSVTADGLTLKFYKDEFHCINYGESGCGEGNVYCTDVKRTIEEQFSQMMLIPDIFAEAIENYFINYTPDFSTTNDSLESILISPNNIRFYWRDNE